jgi:NAD+ diphosphatase
MQSTRVLVLHEGKALVRKGLSSPELSLLPVEKVPAANLRVYLGKTTIETRLEAKGSAIVLAVVNDNSAMSIEADPSLWQSLRTLGSELSDRDAGLFTQSLAVANWHEINQHCPKCGTPTVIEQGGWVRRCFKDNNEIFPRTDPAIIVAITDQEDRILLGSQGTWEQNRWSILAGFVEAGESLEAAVVREMKEECGLDVFDIEYLYSQSWPFPQSLMLGFKAKADSSIEFLPDGEEIVKLRWFSRSEIKAEAKSLLLPSDSTISRALIELWYGSAIGSADEETKNGEQ